MKLQESDISQGMITEPFKDFEGHHTLGQEMMVGREGVMGLDVGSKIFVISNIPEKKTDTAYDEVGVIIGHKDDKIQVITLSPKDGPWGSHNAYGDFNHELPDALAALDRIFDPEKEFGSIAVLSRVTTFNTEDSQTTVVDAGCNSHERTQLSSTLSYSQLLDKYTVKPTLLAANSALIRRDELGNPITLLPGQKHPDQPNAAQRDKRSVLDRIETLTDRTDSPFFSIQPHRILAGISTAIDRGAFGDVERPIGDIQKTVIKGAGVIRA